MWVLGNMKNNVQGHALLNRIEKFQGELRPSMVSLANEFEKNY